MFFKKAFSILSRIITLSLILTSLTSMIELRKIPAENFSSPKDKEFVEKTKEIIADYEKSLWQTLSVINSKNLNDTAKDIDKIKADWNKIEEKTKSLPAADDKNLEAFPARIVTVIKPGIEFLNKLSSGADKPSAKSVEPFAAAHAKLIIEAKRYYNINLPRILVDETQYNIQIAEKEFLNGKKDECVKILDKVLKTNKQNYLAHKIKGMIYSEKGDYKKAEAEFLFAMSVSMDDPELFYEIALILDKQKRYPDAVNSYEIALKAKKDYPEALYRCGIIQVENKINEEKGIERLNAFIEIAEKTKSAVITKDMIEKANKLIPEKK